MRMLTVIHSNDPPLLSEAHSTALSHDIQGSEFTMHRLVRFATRLRLVVLQTTLLENINFSEITLTAVSHDDDEVELWKKIAFQAGQTMGLIQGGKELFDKESIVAEYPVLEPFLMRKHPIPVSNLSGFTFFIRELICSLYKLCIIYPTDTEL